MISVEQRIAITRLIQANMSSKTPREIITRLELYLYNAANGNSDIYNDTSNIKQRIKNVFTEFEKRKKESTDKVIISRFGALPEKKRKDKRTKTECANTSGANTSGANTEGANTRGANTNGANTNGANTSGANTSGANTEGANNKRTKYIHLLDIDDIVSDTDEAAIILSNMKKRNE